MLLPLLGEIESISRPLLNLSYKEIIIALWICMRSPSCSFVWSLCFCCALLVVQLRFSCASVVLQLHCSCLHEVKHMYLFIRMWNLINPQSRMTVLRFSCNAITFNLTLPVSLLIKLPIFTVSVCIYDYIYIFFAIHQTILIFKYATIFELNKFFVNCATLRRTIFYFTSFSLNISPFYRIR